MAKITEKQKQELYKAIKAELDKNSGVSGDLAEKDLFELLLLSGSIIAQPLIHEYFKPENFEVPGEKQKSYQKYKTQKQLSKRETVSKPKVQTEKIETPEKTSITTTITVNGANYDLSNMKSKLSPKQLAEIRKTFSSEEAFQKYVEFLQSPNVMNFFNMIAGNKKK